MAPMRRSGLSSQKPLSHVRVTWWNSIVTDAWLSKLAWEDWGMKHKPPWMTMRFALRWEPQLGRQKNAQWKVEGEQIEALMKMRISTGVQKKWTKRWGCRGCWKLYIFLGRKHETGESHNVRKIPALALYMYMSRLSEGEELYGSSRLMKVSWASNMKYSKCIQCRCEDHRVRGKKASIVTISMQNAERLLLHRNSFNETDGTFRIRANIYTHDCVVIPRRRGRHFCRFRT